MDCKQALNLITASLDDELEAHLNADLQRHIAVCRGCRNEVELERMTKTVIRRKLSRTPTPPHIAARIADRIANESMQPAGVAVEPWRRAISLPMRKTFFALSGAVALLLGLVVALPSSHHHSHVVPNDGNIIHQTYASFDGLLKGGIAPQIASADPTAVKSFFTEKVNFNVDVPHLNECELMGGTFSQYNNENVAQIIYKHGDDIIYLYEASLDSVMQGGALNLPDEAKLELRRTGWYAENHVPECTLLVWKADSSTICCAVSEMSKDRLLACLRETN